MHSKIPRTKNNHNIAFLRKSQFLEKNGRIRQKYDMTIIDS
jgi:hypothetical protein